MIVIVGFMVAGVALVVWGAVKLRRHNQRLERLRGLRPVTPMRFRRLNVVNRCDLSLACHARSHEPTCLRGRVVGPFINQRLDDATS